MFSNHAPRNLSPSRMNTECAALSIRFLWSKPRPVSISPSSTSTTVSTPSPPRYILQRFPPRSISITDQYQVRCTWYLVWGQIPFLAIVIPNHLHRTGPRVYPPPDLAHPIAEPDKYAAAPRASR